MKVVIVSPPKCGANRLRCLLATAFGLRALDARDAPGASETTEFVRWMASLPDNCVTHTDPSYEETLPETAAALGVTLIAIIRHPFDLFVSNQLVRGNREHRQALRARNRDSTAPEGGDNEEVDRRDPMETFAADVQSLLAWSQAANVTLRYEEIVERPEPALAAVTDVVGELNGIQIAHAVKLCPAEQRIVSSGNRGVRMSEIAPGAWRDGLDATTRTQLQSRFGLAVVSLGYDPTLALPS